MMMTVMSADDDGPDEKMPKQQPQSDCRTYLFGVAVDPSFRSDVTRLCVSLSHANLRLGPDRLPGCRWFRLL
jgi:hypothetical protein